MTVSGTVGGSAPAPGDSPGWGESLSREIGDLARAAGTLRAAWNQRFGTEVFQNPLFVTAFLGQVRGHSILQVFKAIYAQDHGSEEPSTGSFEERFERTAEGVGRDAPVFDPVPLSPLDYLGRLVELAEAQKKQGFLVDPQPLERVLTFTSQLKDLPALSGFWMDHLNQFPSTVVESPPQDAVSEEPPALRELPEGYRIGKVQVVRRLGVGGFAQVYLVFHAGLREYWAAKLFTKRDLLGELPKLLKAFYAEAQLQVKLKSPHIVRVIDVEEHEGYLVLFMEYVDGRNLRSLIEERRKAKTHLTPLEILKIAMEGAKGLEYAHTLGIVHRDIKPENILIAQDGGVKITDFGLAKALDATGQRRTTQLGHLLGTPQYMAPEQILGGPYDHRVDLYSLGVVIYHMAWGQPPFIGDPWELLDMQKSKKPVPLTHRMKDFPEDLNRVVLKLLEKKPDNRYPSATELIKDLEACRAKLGAGDRAKPRRRKARVLALAGLLAASLAGAGAWIAQFRTEKGGNPSDARINPVQPTLSPSPAPAAATDKGSGTKSLVKNDLEPDLHKSSTPKQASPKPVPVSERKPEAPARTVPFREQLLAAPPRAPEAAFLGNLVDLFRKHRTAIQSRFYDTLAEDIRGLSSSGNPKTEFTALEVTAAADMIRLAGEFVQARFQALARSKEEIRLKLTDGTTAHGVVDTVGDGSIWLLGSDSTKSEVCFVNVAPEEFLVTKAAPLAELAFQALSGDAVQALTAAVALEKDQDRIVLWYPYLARLTRLEIEEKLGIALVEAVGPLAKGERGEKVEKQLTRYAGVIAIMDALSKCEGAVTSLFEASAAEFDRSKMEREAAELFLLGRFSKVLAAFPASRATPLAARLLLAGFLVDFEAPIREGAARKTDEIISGGGWSRYEWKLHPDEKSFTERQQFWQLDDEKQGSILRDPAGPRSLIMYRPHSRLPQGAVLRFEFEPLGERGATSQWRLLVLGAGGKDNTLRFDGFSVGLFRKFALEPGTKPEALAFAVLPQAPNERKVRTYVLIPGEEGFHLFVDGDLVLTLPKSECILPTQLQVAVTGGRLYMQSVLVLTEVKK
jgi:serine/threonine-protein kinase